MRHILCETNPQNEYPTAILIKDSAFNQKEIELAYFTPLAAKGFDRDSMIAFDLQYTNKKAPAKESRKYLNNLLKALDTLKTVTLLVADATYFKYLTGVRKADPELGYVKKCTIAGFEHMRVVLSINYQALFYNPETQSKLDISLNTLCDQVHGLPVDPGINIIHSENYPSSFQEISDALDDLHQYPALTCDIEAFSLKHYKAGIGTITFCWDEHNGIAFDCDFVPYLQAEEGNYGEYLPNLQIQGLLRMFFRSYRGTLMYHNATYDLKVLIYVLWMNDITDHVGLQEGLDILTQNFDCTKIITYLATNTCAGNKLSLKDIAQEFSGNYAEDVTDIRRIPNDALLKYNLIDGLNTWYAYNKNFPKMVQDSQLDLYKGLFKESLITLIQMELTGMPIFPDKVQEAKRVLTDSTTALQLFIQGSPLIKDASLILRQKHLEKDFEDRKDKAKNPEKIEPKLIENIRWEFNPGSGKQLAVLLHEVMGLPILETTKTGLPATDGDTLEALVNHTENPDYKELINKILILSGASKILSTFIPAFEQAQLGDDGNYYLFGNFNLGGCVSGRMSANDPNLQQIPSGSTYAKLIKACFGSKNGWVFCGADFASLEDRISALITKDSNKLKVYIDGYDGHCLKAFKYFPERLPGIVDTLESINSIKQKFPVVREDSKPITFMLTYGGTHFGLRKNLGFPEDVALEIEANYHKLYVESDEWVHSKLIQASKDGYVTVAFGLRVRTPILAQVVMDTSSTPYEARAEGRTAGNALGQSYGLLNNRAANEFMRRVRNSEYRYDIRICAMIHDATYLLIKDNLKIAEWVNNHLIECMSWQELPELKHDIVKLGAELDLFYPSWKDPITIPNGYSVEEIKQLIKEI